MYVCMDQQVLDEVRSLVWLAQATGTTPPVLVYWYYRLLTHSQP